MKINGEREMKIGFSGCCTTCHEQSKVAVESYLRNLSCTSCNNKTLVGWRVYEMLFPAYRIVWKTHKLPTVLDSESRARRIMPVRKLRQIITGEYGEV